MHRTLQVKPLNDKFHKQVAKVDQAEELQNKSLKVLLTYRDITCLYALIKSYGNQV